MVEKKYIENFDSFEKNLVAVVGVGVALVAASGALMSASNNFDSIQGLREELENLKDELRAARDEYRRFFADRLLTDIFSNAVGIQDTINTWDGTVNQENLAHAFPLVRANNTRIITYMFNLPGFMNDADLVKLVEMHDLNVLQERVIRLAMGVPFTNIQTTINNLRKGGEIATNATKAIFERNHYICSGPLEGGFDGEPYNQTIGYIDETNSCLATHAIFGDSLGSFNRDAYFKRAELKAMLASFIEKRTAKSRQAGEEFIANMIGILGADD